MNAFDLVVCILLAVLVLYGLVRGLVQVVLSIGALIAAFVVANAWHEPLASTSRPPAPTLSVRRIVAWAALFVAVNLGGVLSWLASRLARRSGSWTGWRGRPWVRSRPSRRGRPWPCPRRLRRRRRSPAARLAPAPYVTAVSDWINVAAPDGLAQRYERASAALKRTWRDRG